MASEIGEIFAAELVRPDGGPSVQVRFIYMGGQFVHERAAHNPLIISSDDMEALANWTLSKLETVTSEDPLPAEPRDHGAFQALGESIVRQMIADLEKQRQIFSSR